MAHRLHRRVRSSPVQSERRPSLVCERPFHSLIFDVRRQFDRGKHAAQGSASGKRVELIDSIAGAQDGLVTRQQLLEAGLSKQSIDRRRQNGTLKDVHAGVY